MTYIETENLSANQEQLPDTNIKLRDIFSTFLTISLLSIGGNLPNWAQIMIVDKRKWLSNEEFLCIFTLCRIIPGPNSINLAILLGRRLYGHAGIFASLAGLLIIPFFIVLGLGNLYIEFKHIKLVDNVLHGLAIAAVGMTFGMGLKSMRFSYNLVNIGIVFIAFLTVGVFQWPLIQVMIVLMPLSIGLAWRNQKNKGKGIS